MFPAIGIACLLIAPFAFIKSLRRSGDIYHLVQDGTKLQGVLTDVQSTGGGNSNNSYKIIVSAVDSAGTVQSFVSDRLAGVGALTMADFRNNPIPIDVYLNPTNPQDYYVDVSDIPNLTPERITELLKSVTHAPTNPFVSGQNPATTPTNPANPTPTQNL